MDTRKERGKSCAAAAVSKDAVLKQHVWAYTSLGLLASSVSKLQAAGSNRGLQAGV